MTEELPVVEGMRRVRPSHDDNIKQRLRAGIHKSTDPYELGDEAANHIESCELGISQCLSRIEQLEAALREIAKTVTIVDESWHPSYHDFRFTQKQMEELSKALGEKMLIARAALEEKKDG